MKMTYPLLFKTIPICAIWLALCILALAYLEWPNDLLSQILTSIVALASVVFAFKLSGEIFFKQINLKQSELSYTQAWSQPRTQRWADVTEVDYSPLWHSFKLKFDNGEQLNVSVILTHLTEFLGLMAHELPHDKYIDAVNKFSGAMGGDK
ncbi:hypothetical protein [Idiomarina sp.]|uniref:hypothetical protein n=1 Tax=Idiomarina sp. TaxID=1874361 RepID=UPI0035192634